MLNCLIFLVATKTAEENIALIKSNKQNILTMKIDRFFQRRTANKLAKKNALEKKQEKANQLAYENALKSISIRLTLVSNLKNVEKKCECHSIRWK